MPSIDWQVAAAIATIVSTLAFIASAIVVVLQLRQAARERYFSITAHLFEIWQSSDFQHDQLFLLHMLSCTTWGEFCRLGRGERAELAIHRVGGYYDRVGNLVRHNLIDKQDILPTIGGYAVAVWHRIEPLVKELRLRENALLFENYESLLPDCHECYVPGIAPLTQSANAPVRDHPVSDRLVIDQPMQACIVEPAPAPDIRSKTLSPALVQAASATTGTTQKSLTEMTMGNSKSNGHPQSASDLSLPDSDGIAHTLSEFTASGTAVLVYARGAWCPFCLRQLADYAERYSDFKRSGVEVVALSPETPRKARRMRTGLKLPFAVLSDTNYNAARSLGLMDHEKPGMPTPATLVLDGQGGVLLSTLNQGGNCLFAGDILEYARNLKRADPAAAATIPAPQLASPKPGRLFAQALANMAAGLFSR
jgi:peroxiredoxin